MAWFHYRQNNSGGMWHKTATVDENVFIEATSMTDADDKFMAIGGYFDGCSTNRDCICCGDRWGRAYEDGTDTPLYYGQPLDKATQWAYKPMGDVGIAYPLDGPSWRPWSNEVRKESTEKKTARQAGRFTVTEED